MLAAPGVDISGTVEVPSASCTTQWAGSGGQAVIDQESDEARSRRPY